MLMGAQLKYLVCESSKGGSNAKSALGKGLHLKHAHRAIPDDRLAVLQLCLEALQRLRTNIQALHTCTDMSAQVATQASTAPVARIA